MKSIGFDLGETLIGYNMPLNWREHYHDALREIARYYERPLDDAQIRLGVRILEQYNTRLNPRREEISAAQIFSEILDAWSWNADVNGVKAVFFSYFRRQTYAFEDVQPVLRELKARGVQIGILTDVPYGMDRVYVLDDCKPIIDSVDAIITSVDVGCRKPDVTGYQLLSASLGVRPSELVFVGDEDKDIVGANDAGCFSVLIDRKNKGKSFGEKLRITALTELLEG